MTLGEAIDHVRLRVEEMGLVRRPECYSVSEAVYYLAGGKDAGLTPMRIHLPGEEFPSHWFLRGPHGEIIDLTAGQFSRPPDYRTAIGRAFYPQVSNLAKELMK